MTRCIQVVSECTVPEHGEPTTHICKKPGKLRGPTKVGPLCELHFAMLLERIHTMSLTR